MRYIVDDGFDSWEVIAPDPSTAIDHIGNFLFYQA